MKNFQYYLERVNKIINEETMSGEDALKKFEEHLDDNYKGEIDYSNGKIDYSNGKKVFSDPISLELIIESIAPDAYAALEFAKKYFSGEGWAASEKYFEEKDRKLTVKVALTSIASNPETAFKYLNYVPSGWHSYLKPNSDVYKNYLEIPYIALDTIKNSSQYKRMYERKYPKFIFSDSDYKKLINKSHDTHPKRIIKNK